MTANLNLVTEHLSPILPLTRTASRACISHFIRATFESLWFHLWSPSCILGNFDTTARWKSCHPDFVVFFYVSSPDPVLLAKYRTRHFLCKSNIAQIALVGLRIHPQNGQNENFTYEPPTLRNTRQGHDKRHEWNASFPTMSSGGLRRLAIVFWHWGGSFQINISHGRLPSIFIILHHLFIL